MAGALDYETKKRVSTSFILSSQIFEAREANKLFNRKIITTAKTMNKQKQTENNQFFKSSESRERTVDLEQKIVIIYFSKTK